jgi:protein-tyrosine phosphatase
MVVTPEYLRAAYDAVEADYGSVEGYLRDGLGLDEATLAALRARLAA